jgi:glycerol-3-phosphate dehydrogenase (NAD(P)+)
VKTAVVGAGAFGTALAAHLARAGHEVRLWAREAEIVEAINTRAENPIFLPGMTLPAGLVAVGDLGASVDGAEVVVVAVPSEFCRTTYRALRPRLGTATLVSATKGIELDTLRRMSQIAAEEAPEATFVAVSGPSFAVEVAAEQPTALVAASLDEAAAQLVQRMLSTRRFRVYASSDVVGVELCGSLKNVVAIAAGTVDGLGYGFNTVAALLTRGLAEISRLGVAEGGRPETFAGLAGLGDLVLTCTGGLSRNRRVGQALGRGLTLSDAIDSLGGPSVAEGVRTTVAACALAERAGVEMPIARQMRAVLYEGKSPRVAVDELMLRSLKKE